MYYREVIRSIFDFMTCYVLYGRIIWNMTKFIVRNANVEDTESILKIYEYYVLNTAISFECAVPSTSEFKERVIKTLEKYPYYVALLNDKIVGYTYAAPYCEREAYRFSATLTIYIDKNYTKQGIGKLLYNTIENRLIEMGITNLYASIGIPEIEDEYLNFNSLEFHKHLGFNPVGKFQKCGKKFDRWYSIIWAEKIIAVH